MKGAFYTYLLLVGIEYILACKMIVSKSRYFYARLAGGIFLPLMMMPYYLLGPALFVQFESIPLEIVFANLALLATSTSAFLLETVFEKSEQTAGVKTILVLLFLITLLEFIVFNTRLPWYDILPAHRAGRFRYTQRMQAWKPTQSAWRSSISHQISSSLQAHFFWQKQP